MDSTQISDIIDKHQRAAAEEIAALGFNASGGAHVIAASKRVKSAKPAKTTAKKHKGEKRDPVALEALTEKLFEFVKAHPGIGIEAVSKGMKVTSRELHLPMQKLKKSKRIVTKGQKRSTTYTTKGA